MQISMKPLHGGFVCCFVVQSKSNFHRSIKLLLRALLLVVPALLPFAVNARPQMENPGRDAAAFAAPQQSWQKISNPTAIETAAIFASPPPEYSAQFTWGWGSNANRGSIGRDLDDATDQPQQHEAHVGRGAQQASQQRAR